MSEKRRCSGRDLNPGSATRKAAMLDRTVQPLGASTPPELQLEYFRNIIKSFLILLILHLYIGQNVFLLENDSE
jgi:hypothetical protein